MGRFEKAIWISVGLVGLVAVFDFFQYPKSFWLYSFALAIVAAFIYFIFSNNINESIAIFASFFIMLASGLEDLIFYLIRPLFHAGVQLGIPDSIPHLTSHPFIGRVAGLMGYATVTPSTLIVSVIIGGVLTYITITLLRRCQ